MRKVCAWCKKVIEEGDAPTPVSHGICSDCEDEFEAAPLGVGPPVPSDAFMSSAFWTSERYGIFLLACLLVIAILIGYAWGGSA